MRIDFGMISNIANIALLVTFIISMAIGFLRGFRKSLINLIANVVVIVLTIVFCGLVSKIVINIDLSSFTGGPSPQTLSDVLKNTLINDLNVDPSMMESTINFAESAAAAIIRLVTYILLLGLLLIIKPLLKLILKAFIPFESGKTLGFRFIGLGVSFVSYVLLTFFLTAPIFGIYGMVNQVVSLDGKEREYQELNKGIVLGTSSMLFTEEYTLQAELTSKLMEIETKHGKLNLKNELDSHEALISVIVNNMENEEQLVDEILNNYDQILDGFNKSEILNVTMPIVVELVRAQDTESGINYDSLVNANWTKEKQNLVDILKALCEFIDEVGLDLENPESMLGHPSLPSALKKVGTAINNSGVMKDVVLVYVNDLVQTALFENQNNLEGLADVIDLTKLDLEKDLETIGLIINDINKTGLLSGQEFNVLNNIDTIDSLIHRVFNLTTIKNNETKVIKSLVELAGFDTALSEMGINLNYDNVNWETEVDILTTIIKDILNLVKDSGAQNFQDADIIGLLMDEENKEKTTKIIESLADSDLISGSLISLIGKVMTEAGLASWKSDLLIAVENNEIVKDKTWVKQELLKMIDIYSKIEEFMNIDFTNMTLEQLASLEETLLQVNSIELITLDNIMPMINDAIRNAGFDTSVLDKIYDRSSSTDFNNNKDEWSIEIPRLIDVVSKINEIEFTGDLISSNSTSLAALLSLMKESFIFGNDVRFDGSTTLNDNVFNSLVVEILLDNGLIDNGTNNGFIDYQEARNDDWTRYDYAQELSIINEYDPSLDIQNDDVIGRLQTSEIIKKYFNIAGIINDKIADVSIDLFGQTIALKDYINGGNELTNDDLKTRNWATEISEMNTLIDAFDVSDLLQFKEELTAISNSENNTLASDAASQIISLLG